MTEDEAKARLGDLRVMLWTNCGIWVDHDGDGWRVVAAHKDILDRQSVRELEGENAKLRKLCEVLINCGRKYHTMSGSCPLFDASAENDDFCGAVKVARELGIEVDDV